MKMRFLGVDPAVACFCLAVALIPLLQAEEAAPAMLRAQAEKGNVLAQYNLGLAYAEGRAVPQDLVEAYVWLRLATDNGSTGRALDGVIHQMSIEQIAAGRLRLDELRHATPAVVSDHHDAAATGAAGRATVAAPLAPPAPTEDRFVAMQEELATLRVDNERLTQRLASLPGGHVTPQVSGSPADQKKIADLGAQLEAVRAELAAARKANEDLSGRGKALLDGQEALKRQLADRGDTAQRLAEAQSAIEQLKKENAGLQAQRNELADRLAQAAAAPPPAASQAPAATPAPSDELARLKDELSRANSKVEMTVRSFTLLQEENARLKAQLAQIKTP
jgi:regulator of replication initiation timing